MTALALNPVAVSSVALLRAIRDARWTNRAELAEASGRDRRNMSRDLSILVNAGLIEERGEGAHGKPVVLSDDGAAQLDAINRAERGGDEPGSPDPAPVGDILFLRHDQIVPNPDNDRQDWESAEAVSDLAALADDIAENGLLQNLNVRPGPDGEREPLYTLIGGERRWRAIGILIGDGRWDEDTPIVVRLRTDDDLGHRLAALSENLQRRNLNPLEKARAFDGLAKALGDNGVEADRINREIADRVGVTIEHVQQHRAFMKLDDADQQRLTLAKDDPRRLTVSDARKKLSAKGAESEAVALDPMARLAWIELTDAAYRMGRYSNLWNDVVVAPDAELAPEAAQLIKLGAIQFEGIKDYGAHLGRFTAKRHYAANSVRIDPPFPSAMLEGDEARTACLRAEQQLALGDAAPVWPEGGVTYATPWLARPGEMTPEGVALVEADALQRQENEKAQQGREAAIEARNARWAAARKRHIELFAAAVTEPVWGVPQQTIEIAAEIDRPLPWSVTHAGKVLDARGAEVAHFGNYNGCSDQGRVTARMIVAAVNAAGGLATPSTPEPVAEDEEPEQDIDGNDPDAEGDPDERDEADA